ncbi:hypothetical protein D3C76_796970 [compost metagenome]
MATQENQNNGVIDMSEQNLNEVEVTETEQSEFEAGQEVDTTTAPDANEAADEAKDTRVWTSADGKEISKSEFIREQFTVNNLSRKEISEQFDINYRTVYGATVNMTNDAEPSTRGRAASVTKITVTADNRVVSTSKNEETGEEVTLVNNQAVTAEEAAELGELTEVDRNEWIQSQVDAGVKRSDVADALGLSYGVIYQQTKENSGTRQRYEIEYNGETISRSEYIRRKFAEGVSKADIAKELGVDYPVVWSALKDTKTDSEKFLDAVEKVAKFADVAVDAAALNALVEQLKAVEIKQPEAEVVEAEAADAAEATEPATVEDSQESVYTEE